LNARNRKIQPVDIRPCFRFYTSHGYSSKYRSVASPLATTYVRKHGHGKINQLRRSNARSVDAETALPQIVKHG
jgi:hypothetical protein